MSKPKKEAAIVIVRSLDVIASEIRTIDATAKKIVLDSVREIGTRLTEAKEQVSHGEWGKWLTDNVNYSQSTANNFMRVAKEYQLGSGSEALSTLNYTQAVQLLALPAEEREAFAEENNVSEMSTRELKAAIEEKQMLEQRLREETERADAERNAREAAEEQQRLQEAQMNELNTRQAEKDTAIAELNTKLEAAEKKKDTAAVEKIKKDLKEANTDLTKYRNKIKELQDQLAAKPIDIPATVEVEVVPEEVQKELETLRKREEELTEQRKKDAEAALLREEEARKQLADLQEQLRKNNNTAALKVKMCFDTLVKSLNDMMSAITEVESEEARIALRERVTGLIEKTRPSV